MTKILLKRGNFANLPSSADLGELLVALDNNKLYLGKGAGQSLTDLSVPGPQGYQGTQGTPGAQGAQGYQGTPGSSSSSVMRYKTASAPNCTVLATGPGVDIVITGSNPPTATITLPVGVEIITASVYFTAAQIGTTTSSFTVVLPTGFGVGVGANYSCIQAQTYRDSGGARAAIGTFNFNTGQGNFQMTGLVTNSPYVCNIAF